MNILRSQLFDPLQFQEEDEVPDDETLNQMIARNEDEFELYMVFKKKIKHYLFINQTVKIITL